MYLFFYYNSTEETFNNVMVDLKDSNVFCVCARACVRVRVWAHSLWLVCVNAESVAKCL